MKISDLKVTVLNQADASDPLNQLLVVGAKATVDGVACGWRAMVFHTGQGFAHDFEVAAALLIKKILKAPKNELKQAVHYEPPDVTFEIPDVPLDEEKVA